MPEDLTQDTLEDDICVHIFTVSATLIGVCLTVIGLFRVILRLKGVDSIGDNLLAIDALDFMTACVISYVALRTKRQARRRRLERIADYVFLTGLTLMAIVCALIAYTLI